MSSSSADEMTRLNTCLFVPRRHLFFIFGTSEITESVQISGCVKNKQGLMSDAALRSLCWLLLSRESKIQSLCFCVQVPYDGKIICNL